MIYLKEELLGEINKKIKKLLTYSMANAILYERVYG